MRFLRHSSAGILRACESTAIMDDPQSPNGLGAWVVICFGCGFVFYFFAGVVVVIISPDVIPCG